ncbi:PA14 domain-containing protein [Fusarium keratoplasticum]|nr:PA14 domain-containing protein [Fusarium keratoplasticum]
MGSLHFTTPSREKLLQDMTTSEKIALLSGIDFWHTASIPRLNIPKLRMSDGPNGVRGTKFFDSVPAACLPCGTALGATWNKELMKEAGDLIARECHAKSAHVWLGPTVNIQRSPLGGRGFESFSEDPLLSGIMAGAIISSVQKGGIASSLKHFVANDMEHERTLVDCRISQRALREIYLLPFQLAIRDANPWALMTAYNRVNGLHMCENSEILQDIVRREWNYDGCILSDWFGTYSTVEAINAGLDLEMPGPTEWRGKKVSTAMSVGKISNETISQRASSVLKLIERCSKAGIPESGPEICLDSTSDRDVLRRLGSESMVLLKNDRNILPLDSSKSVAVIGPNLKKPFFCGGGSASLRPYRSVSILEGLNTQLEEPVQYAEACRIYNMLPALGDLVRSPKSGKLGHFLMSIYSSPPWEDKHTPLETFELDDTNIVLYDYRNAATPDNVLFAAIEADFVVEQAETYAFGLTVAGTAKLYLDDRLIIDNAEKQTRGESFFGSGSVEEIGYTKLEAGKVYRLRVDFGSAATSNLNKAGAPVFGAGGVRIGCAPCVDQGWDLNKAVELAKTVDQVVLSVGLGPEWESEGSDRTELGLPGRQAELISRVCAVNENVVVVIQSGTPVSGLWDEVPAVLQTWYGGNESGHSIADVLLGKTSPSGKLPLSWPMHIEDTPAFLSYRSEAGRCYYSEDIHVGYRFYEKTKRPVQWPFGHGLSYASFELDHLTLTMDGSGLDSQLHISVAVTNTSTVDGSETCQAYVKRISESKVSRPIKELKGFTRSSPEEYNGMTTAARVFHHAPRPISIAEFRDAVEAVCRPRFPAARSARPQRVVLAISGGVDSMALAFLTSRMLQIFRHAKIADNPAHGALAVVIDHRLRDESTEEAIQVAKELRKLDLKTTVTALAWKEEKRNGLDPRKLPNLEGLARTYRYRALGNHCNYLGATSLFFAHHRDDQYETVLMRLLGGHGYRGLQGIREANSIPECYDMHGVYKSGLIDDQRQESPFLSFKPPIREMRRLRSIFRDEKMAEPRNGLKRFGGTELVDRYPGHNPMDKEPNEPYLKPLEIEDGGVMIYRPLLEFDKDRLIATCEANKIPWVEDRTNKDPTLTTRNAIRYLVRNHELPKALQKPAILALAERAKRRTKFEEAEAHRYLVREAIIKDFDPNAGTLLIQFPNSRPFKGRRKRRSLNPDNELRKEHRRLIMAIAVRKLIDFVTPEYHLPPLANLDNVVNRLIPDLAPNPGSSPPKAFAMSGVLFDPIAQGNSVKWFLSRAPYTSNQPLPMAKLFGVLDHRVRFDKEEAKEIAEANPGSRIMGWKRSKMFDGRYWVRIGYNNRPVFLVQPYRAEYAKAFRKALPPMRRARLEKLLKHYAPGKIRYSLPALYGVERERDHYSQHVTTTLTLLALPSLGIHIPGLERWVKYEVRYRNVDKTLLGHHPRGERTSHVYYRPLFGPVRRQRLRLMGKHGPRR